MDKPVLALIILVVGVGLAIVSASMVFGYLVPWQASGKVYIERVDITWHPTGSYILVTVRNAGGVPLSSCTARMLNPLTNIDDVVPGVLPPGGAGTFAENGVPDLNLPDVYVFEVSCQTPQGLIVADRKSAQPHL
jgi:hypothetical protein